MLKGLLNFCSNSLRSVGSKQQQTSYGRPNFGFKSTISNRSTLRYSAYLLGASTAGIIGVFGGSSTEGMNFKMSPHFSLTDSYKKNLKAMAVSMMMNDNLDEDEISILMNAVETAYEDENKVVQSRKEWCFAEMKNYMNCSERHGSLQDDRCKGFRFLLKNCLQAKKCAVDFIPPKLDFFDNLPPSTCKKRPPCANPKNQSVNQKSCKVCPDNSSDKSNNCGCKTGSSCAESSLSLSKCINKAEMKTKCSSSKDCASNNCKCNTSSCKQENQIPSVPCCTELSTNNNDTMQCSAVDTNQLSSSCTCSEPAGSCKCNDKSPVISDCPCSCANDNKVKTSCPENEDERKKKVGEGTQINRSIEYAEWCRLQKIIA